jgi:hypothetical protein
MNSVLGFCSDSTINGVVFKLKEDVTPEQSFWLMPLLEDGSVSKDIIPFPDPTSKYVDLKDNQIQLVSFHVLEVCADGKLGTVLENVALIELEHNEGKDVSIDEMLKQDLLISLVEKVFDSLKGSE